MSRIRKLYYFDNKNIQEMISFLNNRDHLLSRIWFNPLIPLHYLLPLKYKFLTESYILKDGKILKGLISVTPSKSSKKKMEIQKLFFKENCYEDAAQLVQFVTSKYKALGAISFVAKIDDYLPELLKLFIMRCGFSQISYEKLWRINFEKEVQYNKKTYRTFRNSDASTVANLYNESLLPHIRTLLEKDSKDFRETLLKGLDFYNEQKYVIEDSDSKNIIAYLSIQSADNKNFILDITQSSWVELDLDDIISFSISQITKREKNYNLFIKTKRYTQIGEKIEDIFMQNGYECVQNQIVLTNSSAKIIQDESLNKKFTILAPFYNGNLVNQ